MPELGRVRPVTVRDPTAVVERRLTEVLGSPSDALRVVLHALERAELLELPRHPEGLLQFCMTHVLCVLTAKADGAQIATFVRMLHRDMEAAFGSDVEGMEDEAEAPASSPRCCCDGMRVILVEADAVTRTGLARALARTGAVVLAAGATLEETMAADPADADVLLCDVEAPGSVLTLLEVMERMPELSIVARAETRDLAEVTLKLAGAHRYAIVPPAARETEVLTHVLTLWRAMSLA